MHLFPFPLSIEGCFLSLVRKKRKKRVKAKEKDASYSFSVLLALGTLTGKNSALILTNQVLTTQSC